MDTKIKEKLRQLPHDPGVYLMKDRFGSVLYVGKAKDLKKRVSSYFQKGRRGLTQQPKVAAMISLIADIETIPARSETEALLLEGQLIKKWRPRHNTDFTDDKRFLVVRLTLGETLPRFRLARFRREDNARYFGPFAHSGLLRQTLAEMRRTFGILLGDAKPEKLPDGRWQLYNDARAELYGHPNLVTVDEYQARLDQAVTFLEGKSREWLEELREQMHHASTLRRYEKAAELRDLIKALEKTLTPTRKSVRHNPMPAKPEEVLGQLEEVLGLPAEPAVIEGFDISHISGTFCVASMVQFVDGRANPRGYVRFRIKSFTGNDDFRAMEEVVGRRYRRLQDEERPFPGLILIDGGMGQVGAATRAFLAQGIEPPPLIGLAKREETIVFPDGRRPLRLPHHDAGLHLLQRVRDEAHRFANTYNADLRSKRLRETIIDDFPGLGKVRRKALLGHFGSLANLRQASVEEMAKVEGFGPVLAQRLYAFLHEANSTESEEKETEPKATKPEPKTNRV